MYAGAVQRGCVRAALALTIVELAACGRIGFDDRMDGGTGGWIDPAWAYRMPLVIDHLKVAGELVDFPVMVALDDPDLAKAEPMGADLRFVDAAGNVLAHELERFGAGSATTTAWVRVPAVSATVDTTIYLYYGNPGAADAQQPSTLWAGYAGVYHFGQVDPLDVHDASGNNPGTNGGVTSAPGQILGAASFPGGAGNHISAGAAGVDTSMGGSNTVSFWMNYTGSYGNAVFAFYDGTNGYDLWMQSAACFGFNTENSDALGIPASTLVGRWVHVAAVFYNGMPDPTTNQLWIDGTPQVLTNCVGTPQPRRAGTVVLGSSDGYELTGMLDEARVAAGVRPPAWLVTEYRNQADPRAFVTAGAEERAP